MPKVAYSDADRARIRQALIAAALERMSRQGVQHTTVEEIYRDNEYDHWFTAQQALEYGFVDKIVTTPDTINAD